LAVQYSVPSSSFQFFMNTPVTAWPWSRSSMAATDESTPPDMPTMMRAGDERVMAERGDGSALREWAAILPAMAPTGHGADGKQGYRRLSASPVQR